MSNVEAFVAKFDDFYEKSQKEKTDILAYYYLSYVDNSGFSASDIKFLFSSLNIQPYTKLNEYLRENSKGRNKKYLKSSELKFSLVRSVTELIKSEIGIAKAPDPNNSDFIPLSIFLNTRGYIEKIGEQMISSYDVGIYDGCSVLMRKLLELLIIEIYEQHQVDSKIKDSSGHFYHLGDLITLVTNEPSWNLSRNCKQAMKSIKKIGDLSAHNRRFIARKLDMDKIKEDVRIVFEELIHLNGYK